MQVGKQCNYAIWEYLGPHEELEIKHVTISTAIQPDEKEIGATKQNVNKSLGQAEGHLNANGGDANKVWGKLRDILMLREVLKINNKEDIENSMNRIPVIAYLGCVDDDNGHCLPSVRWRKWNSFL